jgi:hypothetical protein
MESGLVAIGVGVTAAEAEGEEPTDSDTDAEGDTAGALPVQADAMTETASRATGCQRVRRLRTSAVLDLPGVIQHVPGRPPDEVANRPDLAPAWPSLRQADLNGTLERIDDRLSNGGRCGA